MVSSGERGSRFQAFDRVLDEGGLKHARRLPSTSGSASGSALRPAKSNFTALQAIQKDGSGNAKRGSTLEVIRVPEWSGPEWGWLVHGFSTRPGGGTKIYRPESKGRNGDLNLGFTASDM